MCPRTNAQLDTADISQPIAWPNLPSLHYGFDRTLSNMGFLRKFRDKPNLFRERHEYVYDVPSSLFLTKQYKLMFPVRCMKLLIF